MKRLIALGCIGIACGPSIKQQMKAATDGQIAAARSGGHDEARPRSYQPKDWAVGQWILFKTAAKDGAPTVTRISVIDREGAGYWL